LGHKKNILFDRFLWAIDRWFKIKGDENLRVDYDLNDKSVVFDVGGYKGDFTNEINKKYHCDIYVFEPIAEFYNLINERFENQQNIKSFKFGLSSYDKANSIFMHDNASSVFKKTGTERIIY
jgi:phospholipid N-methyltransferase